MTLTPKRTTGGWDQGWPPLRERDMKGRMREGGEVGVGGGWKGGLKEGKGGHGRRA